jgi:hypothetical protein
MDTAKLLDDLGIPHDTKGKSTGNWLQVHCPFCDDPSEHGGFYRYALRYHCWRCKGGTAMEALQALSSRPQHEIARALKECGGAAAVPDSHLQFASSIKLPGRELLPYHRNYLLRRGLDPDFLVRQYGILGTNPFDTFDGQNYGNRIIIPIYDFDGMLVSFQGRDVTGCPGVDRYKVCPVKKSLMHYKDLVYGGNLAKGDRVVVVEGVVDAWKLGPGAVATFGTGCKKAQIMSLTRWKEVIFFFDPEPAAQAEAHEYAEELARCGVQVSVAYEDFGSTPDGKKRDVGDLAPHEIARIRSELGL